MWPESSESQQPLRNGLTTGSCATACCVAAARALLADKQPATVEVSLPRGEKVNLSILEYSAIERGIRTATVKDAGDDPDATHGATLFVELRLTVQPGIVFKAATGVGTVTREGLVLDIGEPAINPVPRQMMRNHLQHYAHTYHYQGGFEVSVGIENGEQIAKHTMNGRLGIIGGLSILGTTGIVRPYSCSAYIASIHQGIDVARANEFTHLAASTGIASERAIKDHYQMHEISLIEMGDFVGAMLKYLRREKIDSRTGKQIKKLSISAGFGKLTKLANGHLDLNSRQSSIDFQQLADIAGMLGASASLQNELLNANTSIEVLNKSNAVGLDIATVICKNALAVARNIVHESIDIEVWAVDRKGLFVANSYGHTFKKGIKQ
ncbi:cobalt-precorrin-5B (C(1))-methyltransferase [Psychromonas sp. psych-6C06]|uniref:cobalt-precorrin-5B (C(1))-methyltransferase n=1 Tax=Psychromonas sp. psych-6C06 TaxID=2058089 RepID=UPI000C32DB3E|nr:cobalt-precorrin-5B (C(1))-methyltransferase [Psychromonas sp. psych-6C06]PKF61596.1 cobalt-precorrin-5B (C(1))-methyltransferase [Psychromonas sp. psych-6C06]